MGNLINKLSPEWILGVSLAATYSYSGSDLLRHPKSWYWAIRPLPNFAQEAINSFGLDLYLQIQGAVELTFAVILIMWFLPRILISVVAALIAIQMVVILLLVGLDGVTFRDVGLLGAAISLYILIYKNRL